MASSASDGFAATDPTTSGSPRPGTVCLDTANNKRVAILMETVAALSRAEEPQDVLRTFGRGLRQLQGEYGYISLSTRGLRQGEYRITRLIHAGVAEADRISGIDSWSARDAFPIHTGGFIGGLIRQAFPEVLHHLDVHDDPVLGSELARYGSLMAIPLFDDGEPLNWALMLRTAPEGFSMNDLEESILRANLVGATVRNVLAAKELRVANARVKREMEQIARIQRTLLPAELPVIPGVSLGTSYETFDTAGGDIYAIRPVRPRIGGGYDPMGPWAVLIGDVSGHGPAAAVVMAMLYAIFEAYPHEPAGPGEVLAHANRHLHAKNIENTFVTAFLGLYDPIRRRFTYARAGHNPPLLMTKGEDEHGFERLDRVGGIPMAILPDVEYEERTVELHPGQTLLLYTDGITEAMNVERRMFGVDGIEHSLRECTGAPDCAIHHVGASLASHQGNVRPDDDQTLVVMRIDDA